MTHLVDKSNPVLRKMAQEVSPEDIGSTRLSLVIERMKEALAEEQYGVAIAAPQIGEPLRLFVVSGKIFKTESLPNPEDMVFINPRIKEQSPLREKLVEGCLSIPGYEGMVLRSGFVRLSAMNEYGDTVDMPAEGLLAQIFQHEVDHLDGILYVDKALEIHTLDDEATD